MEDRFKFTGSIRYDKAKNFDGNYSPRVSLVYSGGEKKQHNFRASYQTGFRNPSTQDQYIGFNVGPKVLVGSAPDNLLRYSETRPVYCRSWSSSCWWCNIYNDTEKKPIKIPIPLSSLYQFSRDWKCCIVEKNKCWFSKTRRSKSI